jgi:hypothetical protein
MIVIQSVCRGAASRQFKGSLSSPQYLAVRQNATILVEDSDSARKAEPSWSMVEGGDAQQIRPCVFVPLSVARSTIP